MWLLSCFGPTRRTGAKKAPVAAKKGENAELVNPQQPQQQQLVQKQEPISSVVENEIPVPKTVTNYPALAVKEEVPPTSSSPSIEPDIITYANTATTPVISISDIEVNSTPPISKPTEQQNSNNNHTILHESNPEITHINVEPIVQKQQYSEECENKSEEQEEAQKTEEDTASNFISSRLTAYTANRLTIVQKPRGARRRVPTYNPNRASITLQNNTADSLVQDRIINLPKYEDVQSKRFSDKYSHSRTASNNLPVNMMSQILLKRQTIMSKKDQSSTPDNVLSPNVSGNENAASNSLDSV